MKKIKDLKKGRYFTISKKEATLNDIYVRGEYMRDVKKYACHKYNNHNIVRLMSGDIMVFDDFYTTNILIRSIPY